MFPQCIFLSNPPSQYQQKLQALKKDTRFQHNFNSTHTKEIHQLNFDDIYIDSPLAQSSIQKLEHLRKSLFNYDNFDTVVVAPLRKSLQTCYQIFNHQAHKSSNPNKKPIHFYIEPLLADRLNSTHAIGHFSEAKYPQQHAKYTSFFDSFSDKIQKSQWLYDLLPLRVIQQLPSNTSLTSSTQYLKLLKSTSKNTILQEKNCLQTQIQFAQRIQKLKESLLNYQTMSGSGRKLLVIASSQVLNHLGATDFHQNGEPVNPLRLNCGQIDLVNLVFNGFDIIRQLDSESILPFCR